VCSHHPFCRSGVSGSIDHPDGANVGSAVPIEPKEHDASLQVPPRDLDRADRRGCCRGDRIREDDRVSGPGESQDARATDGRAPRRHVHNACQGRRRLAGPADQLHAAVLAALPVDAGRAGRVQACRGDEGLHARARSRRRHPEAGRRRQDVDVQAPQGHQILQRQDRGAARLPVDVPAHLQGAYPDRRGLLQRDRGRRQVPQDAGDVQSHQGRRDQRQGRNHHVPPDAAGCRVALQARRAARRGAPVGHAEQGSRHEASALHRLLHVHEVRPEPRARHGAQPALQAVVGRRAARGLRRQDRAEVRPHGRGRGHAGRERPGRPCSTSRPPIASTRSAPSIRIRCTSTRSSPTGTCR
jgi:hypothetical protein